jgi:hypothetical protein
MVFVAFSLAVEHPAMIYDTLILLNHFFQGCFSLVTDPELGGIEHHHFNNFTNILCVEGCGCS